MANSCLTTCVSFYAFAVLHAHFTVLHFVCFQLGKQVPIGLTLGA